MANLPEICAAAVHVKSGNRPVPSSTRRQRAGHRADIFNAIFPQAKVRLDFSLALSE
jgi:hypothetical protein